MWFTYPNEKMGKRIFTHEHINELWNKISLLKNNPICPPRGPTPSTSTRIRWMIINLKKVEGLQVHLVGIPESCVGSSSSRLSSEESGMAIL